MFTKEHKLKVQIYYEDTDHSGAVYHANFFKYFERAREHAIGIEKLLNIIDEKKIGFAVYEANISYFKPVMFGDTLTIVSKVEKNSNYKLIWKQEAFKKTHKKPVVKAEIVLVCINENKKLAPIPDF